MTEAQGDTLIASVGTLTEKLTELSVQVAHLEHFTQALVWALAVVLFLLAASLVSRLR